MSWTLLKNSLIVSGLTMLLATLFGLLAALFLAMLKTSRRNAFLAVAIVALALPPFLVTNCWMHFLGTAGVWRSWLRLDILSLGGTVWILSLLLWPIPLLAIWSAWQRLEAAQLESDMKVTGFRLLRGLLLPLAAPSLFQAAVLTFVLSLNNFAVPAMLQVHVFPAEMWVRFSTSFDTAGALALSWPLVLGPLLLLLCFRMRTIPWPHLASTVPSRLLREQIGDGWFYLCGTATVLICFLSVGLPLAQLALAKRTWTELPGALAAGRSTLWNSVFFASAAATAIIVVGLLIAARWLSGPLSGPLSSHTVVPTKAATKVLGFCTWLVWLPFLLPGVILGIAFIWLFNRPWSSALYQSAGIVILAFTVRYLALGWISADHAIRTVDRDLTDAARLEGANRFRILRFVHWPGLAHQIGVAWYVVFLLCLWDVESMILILPPGGETLALRIFNLLHYGYASQVNALCVTLVVVAIAPWLIWMLIQSTRRQRPASLAVLASSALLVLAGCSPQAASNEAPLQSQLFSRVQIIGTRGAGIGEFNKPRSVAVDSQDNLYVVDMTGRVQKFSSNGVFLLSWQMPQTDLGKPKGMCRDRDGNILVLEPHYQRVNCFSPQGKLLTQWGQHGTNQGQFMLPRALVVDSHREIFVCEYGAMERVQKFAFEKPETGFPWWLSTFGKPGTGPGEFNRAEGLGVDAHDQIYVADSCNHRIQVFTSDGKYLRAYGSAGSGKGQLSYPYDICLDSQGRQYVCEFGNSRIQVFDASDHPLELIGGPGAEPGQFSNPWSIALDSAGNLYVADSQNHRVQKLIRNPKDVAQASSPAGSGGVSPPRAVRGGTPLKPAAETAALQQRLALK
jgi:ABC-type Fe3+ transport system permease subunit/sugar lactone lactonase YvrE